MSNWKENVLAIVATVVVFGLMALGLYAKFVLYGRDARCLVAECRISK